MIDLLVELLGNTPLTVGLLIIAIVFGSIVSQNTAKILRVYNKIERDLDAVKKIADAEKIGGILARLNKLETDINNVANKSRNSDKILLQHISSHCHQISHIGSYLEASMDYHPPTKMNLPDDMI